MSIRVHTDREVRRLGHEHGRDLAAALVLASGGEDVDRAMKRRMAQIVLHQIEAMVGKLKGASFPADLTRLYERAAREGVRAELLESGTVAADLHRRAA